MTGLERAGRRTTSSSSHRPGRRASHTWPRHASSRSACGISRTRASTEAAWSSCCARSPTWTRSRTRSTGPAWLRTWSAGAATGPSSRWRTRCGCLGSSRIRSTTSSCSGRLRPLDSLIDRVITAFGYDIAILAMRGGEQRMANLRKLMRLAAEYEEHDGRDLRGFLDFAEERTSRDEREGMAALRVEGHDGVRVMTVHAAKGLEFPVVAVADMGRGLGAAFAHPDLVVGRLSGQVGDPGGARFGMRVPVAAAEPLR